MHKLTILRHLIEEILSSWVATKYFQDLKVLDILALFLELYYTMMVAEVGGDFCNFV